jgi:hypothetical protein
MTMMKLTNDTILEGDTLPVGIHGQAALVADALEAAATLLEGVDGMAQHDCANLALCVLAIREASSLVEALVGNMEEFMRKQKEDQK